jgi:hypothetical protein
VDGEGCWPQRPGARHGQPRLPPGRSTVFDDASVPSTDLLCLPHRNIFRRSARKGRKAESEKAKRPKARKPKAQTREHCNTRNSTASNRQPRPAAQTHSLNSSLNTLSAISGGSLPPGVRALSIVVVIGCQNVPQSSLSHNLQQASRQSAIHSIGYCFFEYHLLVAVAIRRCCTFD